MSVPAYKRKESSVEYVYQSVMLTDIIAKICINNFSKKYTMFGNQQVYNSASKLAECCVRANKYNVTQYFKEREDLLNEALTWLEWTSFQLSLLKERDNNVTDNQWIQIGLTLEKLEKLIKGVKQSDKERNK